MPIVIEPAVLEKALAGGVLIGISAAGLLLVNGRIAGISGIMAGASGRQSKIWQWAFLLGLVMAGIAAAPLGRGLPAALGRESLPLLAAAGLLVGFGTRLSNGCTSGHGVCGIAQLNPRSIIATCVFMLAAGLTVFVTRHLLGHG
ncbi:membrane protein [Acidocella aquatica]|uniref:Membrane protein n=1 Tax=Acidocella aquatica TaxID=1922313 RepID=A0ABQ6A8V9_9PROT|nr:YeeE/YedE thiosulfate transporter family protein [Acidocella aquatica]GLR67306.1 membrane protein [Acidocella aquatica]